MNTDGVDPSGLQEILGLDCWPLFETTADQIYPDEDIHMYEEAIDEREQQDIRSKEQFIFKNTLGSVQNQLRSIAVHLERRAMPSKIITGQVTGSSIACAASIRLLLILGQRLRRLADLLEIRQRIEISAANVQGQHGVGKFHKILANEESARSRTSNRRKLGNNYYTKNEYLDDLDEQPLLTVDVPVESCYINCWQKPTEPMSGSIDLTLLWLESVGEAVEISQSIVTRINEIQRFGRVANVLTGDVCRDVETIIIKYIELASLYSRLSQMLACEFNVGQRGSTTVRY